MKLPLSWLREFLPGLTLTPDALAETLAAIGLPIESVFEVAGEPVFDVEVTANRGDCLCVLGLARDLGARLHLPVEIPEVTFNESEPDTCDMAQLKVLDGVKCPLYTARVIRGVRVGPSPDWLKKRLLQMGLEPRNNIVDITNYVMFEMGQPLHAFDLAKLAGATIVVRPATPQDRFDPLYGGPVKLTADDLVIADAEKPVALGGIVGGRDSGITEATRDILLESAYFPPAHVRLRAKVHGFKTDSSMRFERGVDAQGVESARRRAVGLILDLTGGVLCRGVLHAASEHLPMPAPIRLRLSNATRLLGFDIAQDEAVQTLQGLGCKVKLIDEDELSVTPLSSRNDLTHEADLIEELVRMVGFERIPDHLTMLARIPPVLPEVAAARTIRHDLAAADFVEILTDSLVDSKTALDPNPWQAARALILQNPMHADHDALRVGLLRSALETLRLNLSRGACRTFKAFEIGPVFLPALVANHDESLPTEAPRLLLISTHGAEGLQTALAMLAHRWAWTVSFEGAAPAGAGFDPAESCRLLLKTGTPADRPAAARAIGFLGRVAPALAAAHDLTPAPFAAEIDLAPFFAAPIPIPAFEALPRMPATDRDLSLTLPEQHPWGAVHDAILNLHEPLVESLEFGEVYRGKQIPAGRKSFFFKIWFRSAEKTLTREETNEAHDRIVAMLKQKFDATLRET